MLIEGAVACISMFMFLVLRYVVTVLVFYAFYVLIDVCKCDVSMCLVCL